MSEVLCRLREVLPAGVKVTVVADRGFADCKLFYALTDGAGLRIRIRLPGDIYVTNARGERRAAAAWVGRRGACAAVGGCSGDRRSTSCRSAWSCSYRIRRWTNRACLVASEATVPPRVLIRSLRKRWGIEAGFRDQGHALRDGTLADPCFASDRRDRLLLISALAIAVLSLLGAAVERIGYDRWLKANTVKRRTHSLFRQGLMLNHHLADWPEDRIRPLIPTFETCSWRQRVYRRGFRRDLMLATIEGPA